MSDIKTPCVDPLYAEKVVAKFTPFLDAIISQFEAQARDQALKFFENTNPDVRAGLEVQIKSLLARRDHYLQIRDTVMDDPGLNHQYMEVQAAQASSTRTASAIAA